MILLWDVIHIFVSKTRDAIRVHRQTVRTFSNNLQRTRCCRLRRIIKRSFVRTIGSKRKPVKSARSVLNKVFIFIIFNFFTDEPLFNIVILIVFLLTFVWPTRMHKHNAYIIITLFDIHLHKFVVYCVE